MAREPADWGARAAQVINAPRKRPVLIWTPLVLVLEMGLPNTPDNRRHARKALASLCRAGVLLKRAEAHGLRRTPKLPPKKEVAYSLPQFVLKCKTTNGAVYDPSDPSSLTS